MTLQRARYVAKECHSETFHAKLFPDPDELVAEPEDTASEITTLSDAERRVAALAAIGHSNREIAGKLYITISIVNPTKADTGGQCPGRILWKWHRDACGLPG
ncbi:hypothetical protein FAGKG844_220078 [Frankia sp. AgKG'84/4]